MKTIGILGGIGPQATMDFEARVHAVSQRLIPPRANEGYPPMVVYYHRGAPVHMREDGRPVQPMQLAPHFLEAARWLGESVDFLVIVSNGVDRWRGDVEQAARRPVLSMVDLTLAEIERRACQKVGILTFFEPTVYHLPLSLRGISSELLSNGLQTQLDEVIPQFMAGQAGPDAGDIVGRAVDTLRARGVDAIILGCTELPLMLGDEASASDLINPAQLLAEEAVRYAIE